MSNNTVMNTVNSMAVIVQGAVKNLLAQAATSVCYTVKNVRDYAYWMTAMMTMSCGLMVKVGTMKMSSKQCEHSLRLLNT